MPLYFTTGACNYGDGLDCIFPCRCESCDVEKGCDVGSGCDSLSYQNIDGDDGAFSGAQCQIGN